MLIILTAATGAAWLVLWVLLAARTAPALAQVPGAGPVPQAGTEPPAVVSLLDGSLSSVGYPATLLDLAARGWFRLEARPGGPVMCVLGTQRSGAELNSYERRAYAHLVNRAGASRDIPASALGDGFSGGATADRTLKSGKQAFMEAFNADVIEDSRQRGLSRPRLSEPAGCLLWVAALVPAIVAALALAAHRNHAYWIPIVGFFVLGSAASLGVKGEKATPAGQAALDSWKARCARPATTAVPGGWVDRDVAYAAALGRERSAVRLFSDTPGDPRGKTVWSSYGGSWRQITVGDPRPRGCLGTASVLAAIFAVIMVALIPATLATIVLAHGEIRAAAFAVLAFDAVIAVRWLTKRAATPGFAEFVGRVIEAWIEEESGENTSYTHLCLAIDDGVRDRAWVFIVSGEQYRRFVPGTLVHVQANPRGNKLLDIRPVSPSSR